MMKKIVAFALLSSQAFMLMPVSGCDGFIDESGMEKIAKSEPKNMDTLKAETIIKKSLRTLLCTKKDLYKADKEIQKPEKWIENYPLCYSQLVSTMENRIRGYEEAKKKQQGKLLDFNNISPFFLIDDLMRYYTHSSSNIIGEQSKQALLALGAHEEIFKENF
jgi:hypothetical protein